MVYDQLCRNAHDEIIALAPGRDYRTGAPWLQLDKLDADKPYQIYRIPFLRAPAFDTDAASRLKRFLRGLTTDLPVMAGVLARILKLIIRHRVKVVCIGELIYGGWLVLPLRYLFGRHVLIYTHGEEISQDSPNLLARRRGFFLRHAHRIIAVSLFCKGQIISKYNIRPNKIVVVNNGVDLEAFNNLNPDRTIWPEDLRNKKIILSVSRLVDRKGQDALIRCLPSVIERHPEIHCVIVGGGPLEPELKALVLELGLQRHCTVVGPASQDRVVKYFKGCDIFALPCRTLPDGDTEGFGLVFLEAGACGKPVVAGVAGGTVEAVSDGETGFLVDGYQPHEVASALIKLLDDPELASALGHQGWVRAQKCSWDLVTARFLEACRVPQRHSEAVVYDPTVKAFPVSSLKDRARVPKLLVTVDVEEEFGWDRFDPHMHRVRGAEALAAFHSDCHSIGVRPVYLMTYPVLKDDGFRDVIRSAVRRGEAEAGIHLHSWTVPPYWEQSNSFTSYQCNLPEHIEARKLRILSELFKEVFGTTVSIHRAGRWGGSYRTSKALELLGIHCDLSPSAGYTDFRAGGPDFSNLDGTPFWSGPAKSVLTIPASSVNYLKGPRWFSSTAFGAARSWPALRSNAFRRGKPVRFSPENNDIGTLLSIARELKLRGLPTAVYTLHSTSLYAGGNPYSRTKAEADTLRRLSLEFLAKAVEARLLEPSSCAELLAWAKSSQATIQRPLALASAE